MNDLQLPSIQIDLNSNDRTIANWLAMRRAAHEVGLMAERQLIAVGAIKFDDRLFYNRNERRDGMVDKT